MNLTRARVMRDMLERYLSIGIPENVEAALVEEIWMRPERYGIETVEDAGRVITEALTVKERQ